MIINEPIFDRFCRSIASEILSENLLSEDAVTKKTKVAITKKIKVAILLNLDEFILSMLDEVQSKTLKQRFRLLADFQDYKMGPAKYKELTRKVGKIQILAPLLKSANKKAIMERRNKEAQLYQELVSYLHKNNPEILASFSCSCDLKI